MRVWFYVFNHSKYRFLFHAVYIGIVNEIINPNFHVAIYNRFKGLDFDVRSSPPMSGNSAFLSLKTIVILHPEPTQPQEP